MTIRQALQLAGNQLQGHIPQARFEAALLMQHSLQKPRSWLIAHDDEVLDETQQQQLNTLVTRRSAGEPLAYITGSKEFWSLDLIVDPSVLIPRPETELLVEAVLEKLRPDSGSSLLDLGTGSGAIAIAIASENTGAAITATDMSQDALSIAQANSTKHCPADITFKQGSWYAPVKGQSFSIIASNPPYIEENDLHLLDLQKEPQTALIAGADGLNDLREIIAAAPDHLEPEGWLMVEHGAAQGAAVRALFTAAKFSAIETRPDLARHDRITMGQWL